MPVLYRHLDKLPERLRGCVVSIGNFDGVHLGHARIVERLLDLAKRQAAFPVILTFDPHPARLLNPGQAPAPLSWTDRKACLLQELGVEAVVAYPTDLELLQLSAGDFFDRIVLGKLNARGMVEGQNFFFGHDRGGNVEVLAQFCRRAKIPLEVVEPVEIDGQTVSSSRVRGLISAGQIAEAARLLSRPHRIRGTVIHGQGRGNKLGFPTANIGQIDTLLPGEGIYAGRAWIDSRSYATSLSLGSNPTFDESEQKVEAFLLDYEGDLYGRPVEIDFLTRLRDIIRFDSAEQLVDQIARDVQETRRIAETEIPSHDHSMTPIPWPRFVEIVRGHQRFLLICHVRPDCDALGSELAMAGILEKLGKDVLLVNDFAVPPTLTFLDPHKKVKQLGADITAEQLADREVIMVLDTTAWIQLGKMSDVIRQSQAIKMVLDHHVSGDDLGAELFKNTCAEATGRLVVEAADALGVRLTPEMAVPAFAALATDTGWFRFSSTSADTMRLAGRLVNAGARPDALYKLLYEHDSLARLKLIGRTLARTRAELDGRLVHTWIERGDFAATGALASDTEDIINMTLTVAGAEVAVILVEQSSGQFKISLRSRSEVDCSKLAEKFAGGGHKKAAGATVDGPLESAQTRVLDVVRAAVQT